jgi:hypothetical protein
MCSDVAHFDLVLWCYATLSEMTKDFCIYVKTVYMFIHALHVYVCT